MSHKLDGSEESTYECCKVICMSAEKDVDAIDLISYVRILYLLALLLYPKFLKNKYFGTSVCMMLVWRC